MDDKIVTGFTLIEILVVILIMSSLFVFVSPIGSRQIDKAKAEQELHELTRIVKKYSMLGFASGQSYTLQFQNDFLKVISVDGHENWQFDDLYFPKQEFVFNRGGLLSNHVLDYQINGKNLSINIQNILIAKNGVYVYAP